MAKEVTKVTKEMVSVRIPKEMNERLTAYLKQIGVTKNSFILTLLKRELDKQQKISVSVNRKEHKYGCLHR